MLRWWESKKQPDNAVLLVMHHLIDEIKEMNDLTRNSLIVLLTSILFIAVAGILFSWHSNKKFVKIDSLQMSIDDRVFARRVRFVFMMQCLDMQRRLVESMNMALYMSEMRRKGKTQRPRRPSEVELRVPEFLPTLRAERCEKDGVAVLNITDVDLQEASPRGIEQAQPQPVEEVPEDAPKKDSTKRCKRRLAEKF